MWLHQEIKILQLKFFGGRRIFCGDKTFIAESNTFSPAKKMYDFRKSISC